MADWILKEKINIDKNKSYQTNIEYWLKISKNGKILNTMKIKVYNYKSKNGLFYREKIEILQ